MALIACNNQNGEKKGSTARSGDDSLRIDEEDSILVNDFCQKSGSGNFLINPVEAQDMVRNFDRIYRMTGTPSPKPNLQTDYWVDSCIIFALDNFFRDSTRFDGAWILFGADPDQKKTTIFIVPTSGIASGFHEAVWDTNIPGTTCAAVDYFLTKNAARPKADQFRQYYRQENAILKDSLSRKVWVHQCVFRSLAAILRRYSGGTDPLNGISILSAAYRAKNPSVSSQVYNNQSTIVIVTTRKVDAPGSHTPAWDVSSKYYTLSKKTKAVYNHGELCPNACGAMDF